MRRLRPRPLAPVPAARTALAGLAALPVLLVMLLAGCADPGQVSAGGGSGTTTPSIPPASTAPISTAPSPTGPASTVPTRGAPPPSSAPGQPGEMTVRGAVQEGVEAGCLLLVTPEGTQYLLLGGDRQVLRAGASVVVRGRPEPGMMTTCQQGTPFTVVSALPA